MDYGWLMIDDWWSTVDDQGYSGWYALNSNISDYLPAVSSELLAPVPMFGQNTKFWAVSGEVSSHMLGQCPRGDATNIAGHSILLLVLLLALKGEWFCSFIRTERSKHANGDQGDNGHTMPHRSYLGGTECLTVWSLVAPGHQVHGSNDEARWTLQRTTWVSVGVLEGGLKGHWSEAKMKPQASLQTIKHRRYVWILRFNMMSTHQFGFFAFLC